MRTFRPREERLEDRLVLSGNSIPAEVRAILGTAPAGTPVRPNSPVLPFESPTATASFIDPTDRIRSPRHIAIGQRDYVAPFVTLDGNHGFIKIGSSSTIQDHARLTANPGRASGLTGIFIGDSVAIGDGATIIGPAAIGATRGAATSIGANAVIDGAIIEAGAFVGALARVGPGVVVPAGFRVLPGVNVTNDAEASNPSMGLVARVVAADTATAARTISDNVALAAGYANLFQGQNITGGANNAGPVPSAVGAAGSTIFFGALNTVLGASSEPGASRVNFEPAAGAPQFLTAAGPLAPLATNESFRFPARVIGQVTFGQEAGPVRRALGKGDSIRADEGQPFTIGSIARLGDGVSIHSPNGGVQSTTTTTEVVTSTFVTVRSNGSPIAGISNRPPVTTVTTATNVGANTAIPGTTTRTSVSSTPNTVFGTPGLTDVTTTTTTTTILNRTASLGGIAIGRSFRARNGAVILGGPGGPTAIGDHVTIGAGSVVATSVIGSGAVIGNRCYIVGSSVSAGAFIPDRTIIINNRIGGPVAT